MKAVNWQGKRPVPRYGDSYSKVLAILCFLTRSYSVGRLIPSASAARAMLLFWFSMADTTISRSIISRASFRVRFVNEWMPSLTVLSEKSSDSGSMIGSSDMMTARCTLFSSSRTFPGQSYDSSSFTEAALKRLVFFLSSLQNLRRKKFASSMMSPPRSLSGGRFICMTEIR